VQVTHAKADTETAIFLGDIHIPYHDPVSIELVLSFLQWFRPDSVYIIGDCLDFYAISRFNKDPQRMLSLQEELDAGVALLARIRKAIGNKARLVYLSGNHEHRLLRYLWDHPEISTLNSLRIPSLLRLDEVEADYHDYTEQLQWHALLVEHGDRVRGKSSATACAMLESRGVCGVSGHSHRLGTFYRTDNSGVKMWMENGCLCSLSPSYLIGKPNWCQGFSIVRALRGRRRFLCEQVPILSHRLFYSGRLWEMKRAGVVGKVGAA
jgi:predicted phosphodiesterase